MHVVKVLLSHSVAESDGPLASRLRAVAASYGVTLLLPERREGPSRAVAPLKSTVEAITGADAVLALVTEGSSEIRAVGAEVTRALKLKKPVVLLVEGSVTLPEVQGDVHVVRFDRAQPANHEQALARALDHIRGKKLRRAAKVSAIQEAVTIGAIAGIAIGLLALGAALVKSREPEDGVHIG